VPFRLRIAPRAQHHIEEFAAYLREYSEELAIEQIDGLNRILSANLGESPLTWSYFAFSGAPYRAYLFRGGRRTNIGSSTRSMRIVARSTSFISGMPCAIPGLWICSDQSTRTSREHYLQLRHLGRAYRIAFAEIFPETLAR
jgi:hypothetical protein